MKKIEHEENDPREDTKVIYKEIDPGEYTKDGLEENVPELSDKEKSQYLKEEINGGATEVENDFTRKVTDEKEILLNRNLHALK